MAIVQRAPADRPGKMISSPLLKSDPAKIERGTQDINRYSTDRILKTGSVTFSEFIQPGELIEVHDSSGVSKGMLTGFSIQEDSSGQRSINTITECIR